MVGEMSLKDFCIIFSFNDNFFQWSGTIFHADLVEGITKNICLK